MLQVRSSIRRIYCPEHGWFEQQADAHLNQKQGCPLCGRNSQIEKRRLGIDQILERAKNVFGGYSCNQKIERKGHREITF